jgi:hypothetical protein
MQLGDLGVILHVILIHGVHDLEYPDGNLKKNVARVRAVIALDIPAPQDVYWRRYRAHSRRPERPVHTLSCLSADETTQRIYLQHCLHSVSNRLQGRDRTRDRLHRRRSIGHLPIHRLCGMSASILTRSRCKRRTTVSNERAHCGVDFARLHHRLLRIESPPHLCQRRIDRLPQCRRIRRTGK